MKRAKKRNDARERGGRGGSPPMRMHDRSKTPAKEDLKTGGKDRGRGSMACGMSCNTHMPYLRNPMNTKSGKENVMWWRRLSYHYIYMIPRDFHTIRRLSPRRIKIFVRI